MMLKEFSFLVEIYSKQKGRRKSKCFTFPQFNISIRDFCFYVQRIIFPLINFITGGKNEP